MLGTENPISMTKDSNEVESPSHTSLMHVAARVEAKNASSHFELGQMDFTCSAMAVAWRMYRAWIKSKDKDKCCFNILIFIWLQGECQNCVIRRAGFNVIIIIATHALILRAGPDRSLKPCDLHPVATHPMKRNASYFIPKQQAPLFARTHPGVSEEIQLGGSQ